MRRYFRYLLVVLTTLLSLVSCIKVLEDDAVHELGDGPQGKVTVRFNVAVSDIPVLNATKAETRSVKPQIQTMHVAVFGGSGYLKEYQQATLVNAVENGTSYQYEVSLSLTNSSIKVHFIGNGPESLLFDYETNNIPLLYKSVDDECTDAYWQRIEIPGGIKAKKHVGDSYTDKYGKTVQDGDYIRVDGTLITDGEGYVVSDETQQAMSGIQLIRNFAQINVEAADKSESNFELISYSIIAEPKMGTIAPYQGNWIDYLSYSEAHHQGQTGYDPYADLSQVYAGSMYPNTVFDDSLPSAEAFVGTTANGVTTFGAGVLAGGTPGFIYERPKPENNPSFLIVYGKFYKDGAGSGTPCFYKIDLMEKGVYLALYRNFRYMIRIKRVNKVGKSTPRSAAEGAGSGDISADVNSANLSDISDGTVALYVSEMAPVLVGQQDDYELQYKFITKISEGDNAVNNYYGTEQNACITFSQSDVQGAVINEYTVASEPGNDESNYYRSISIKTTEPTSSQKKETFRITATYVDDDGVTHTLYRNVKFTLLQIQKLWVKCIPGELEKGQERKMTVRVTIPSGLPQSMFPLQFPIEAVSHSLVPDHDYDDTQNLPVQYGKTYQYTATVNAPGDTTKRRLDKNSYYFIRQLNYDEYSTAQSEVDGTVYFDSYFTTSETESASDVYVGCLPPTKTDGTFKSYQYFEPGKGVFTNYIKRQFTWVSVPTYWDPNEDYTLQFKVDVAEIPSEVYVTLEGLTNAEKGSNLALVDSDAGRYKVSTIPDDGTVSIKVHTPDVPGADLRIALSAKHYEDASKDGVVNKVTLTLSPKPINMHVAETKTLTATVTTVGNPNPTVSWTSSNPAVVRVSSASTTVGNDGTTSITLTGVAIGTATITATCGNQTATCAVSVAAIAVESVTLNHNSRTLRPDGTVQLTATVNPANATNKNVTWSSSNTSVATVNNDGLVTAVAPGNATITVTTEDGGKTATCSIIVQRRTWHAASYTINMNSNANSGANSFTTSPQNVVFVNSEADYRYDWGLIYYKLMGRRTNNGTWTRPNYSYSSGYFTVTAPPQATFDGSRIIGISISYDDGQDDRSVTYLGNGNTSLTGTVNAWGTTNTSSTSEIPGYNTVRVTMSCTSSSEYDNRNRISSLTVYYGYFTWENP